ncbi:MAG: HlyD family secretion protein, partial [Clostridiales bacterium]|nr:HlyD family secretion protein [Clostridiales bacterium]
MKVYDLHELTDSRILYDKEPPKFMFYILCVLTGLLFVAFLWAAFSHKTGIIKMQAVVSTTDKRLIMIPTQGVINKIEVQENSQVKENDILLILDDLPVRVQMETLDAQIVYLEEYLAKLTILTERLLQINLSTLTGISNPFNGSDADELYWFNQYKACVKQIQAVATVVPDPLQPDTTIPKPSEELIAEREEILDGYVN